MADQGTPTSPNRTVSWLHISDWHHGRTDFDRNIVLSSLLSDIKVQLKTKPELAQIDFIFFTGDLTNTGSVSEFEDVERELITPLLNHCNLTPDRFVMVPGNHDLHRPTADLLRPDLYSYLTARGVMDRLLSQQDSLSVLLSPFKSFLGLANRLFGRDVEGRADFGFSRIMELNSLRIRVVGMNSSWLCGRRRNADGEVDDYGQLIVGESQIESHLPKDNDEDLVVGLIHHPFSWLARDQHFNDRITIRKLLLKHCDVILHGHEHDAEISVQQSNASAAVVIPAGASYDGRDSHSSKYANAYNFCHIDLKLPTNQVKLYCRRFDGDRAWREDIDLTGVQTPGIFSVSLPRPAHLPGMEVRPVSVLPAETNDTPLKPVMNQLVTAANPSSAIELHSAFLSSLEGGLLVWVYLHASGKGIREYENNRYIFSHASKSSTPYADVFALCLGPRSFWNPGKKGLVWKLWIGQHPNNENQWRWEDSESELPVGWHQIAMRWNHHIEQIEVLFNGVKRIQASDYLKYWPSLLMDRVFVGTWPSRAREFYIETHVAGIRQFESELSDLEIQNDRDAMGSKLMPK